MTRIAAAGLFASVQSNAAQITLTTGGICTNLAANALLMQLVVDATMVRLCCTRQLIRVLQTDQHKRTIVASTTSCISNALAARLLHMPPV